MQLCLLKYQLQRTAVVQSLVGGIRSHMTTVESLHSGRKENNCCELCRYVFFSHVTSPRAARGAREIDGWSLVGNMYEFQ